MRAVRPAIKSVVPCVPLSACHRPSRHRQKAGGVRREVCLPFEEGRRVCGRAPWPHEVSANWKILERFLSYAEDQGPSPSSSQEKRASPTPPARRPSLWAWCDPHCPVSGANPCASTPLCPRGVELSGIGLRVVPVAEHPGQFLALQADHHRTVVSNAAGMVNLPR
jgi:hypothetical protein